MPIAPHVNRRSGKKSSLVFDTDGDQQYSCESGGSTSIISVNKSTGTLLPAAGTTDLGVSALEVSSGTFRAPSGTLSLFRKKYHDIHPDIRADGISIASGGAFDHNGGTLRLSGRIDLYHESANHSVIEANENLALNNLTLSIRDYEPIGDHDDLYVKIATGDTVVVEGDLTIDAGKIRGGSELQILGDVALKCTSTENCAYGGSTPLRLTGSDNQTISQASGSTFFASDIDMDKRAGTVTLLDHWTLPGSSQTLRTLDNSGSDGMTLDLKGFDLTVDTLYNGTNNTLTRNGGTLTVNNFTNAGTLN